MNTVYSRLSAIILLALPVAALAHAGHGSHGFLEGLAHHFSARDHLIAVFAVLAGGLILKMFRRQGALDDPR